MRDDFFTPVIWGINSIYCKIYSVCAVVGGVVVVVGGGGNRQSSQPAADRPTAQRWGERAKKSWWCAELVLKPTNSYLQCYTYPKAHIYMSTWVLHVVCCIFYNDPGCIVRLSTKCTSDLLKRWKSCLRRLAAFLQVVVVVGIAVALLRSFHFLNWISNNSTGTTGT